MSAEGALPHAGFARRIGGAAYEALLIGALLVAVAVALLPAVSPNRPFAAPPGPRPLYVMSAGPRALSAAVSIAASAAYCGWLWSGGRRTLAMKTWRLALRTAAGRPVSVNRALLRYLGCWAGPALAIAAFAALQPLGYGGWAAALLVFNYAWAGIDRERQFFQDRIAGTRLLLDIPGR